MLYFHTSASQLTLLKNPLNI